MRIPSRGVTAPLVGGYSQQIAGRGQSMPARPAAEPAVRPQSPDPFSLRALPKPLGDEVNRSSGFSRRG
ncbi:MAG: hypothetical protein VKP57_00530 [Candidatus Sericytochromatia bacterium]|nr:hypothetical protein [Candidatus Sericytochromatia bacterium]